MYEPGRNGSWKFLIGKPVPLPLGYSVFKHSPGDTDSKYIWVCGSNSGSSISQKFHIFVAILNLAHQ